MAETIESGLTQTWPDHEIIVVDDGSNDDPAQVAARYPNVRFIRQQNQGVSAARNKGLRESQGDYLVFLDTDDRLTLQALAIGIQHLT